MNDYIRIVIKPGSKLEEVTYFLNDIEKGINEGKIYPIVESVDLVIYSMLPDINKK